jgi:NADH:ubiquinone oxidoreductase subunit 6 (subunit J)
MTDWVIADYVSNEAGRFVALGKALFSDFLVPFEIASLVLLVALVGAVILTREGREGA